MIKHPKNALALLLLAPAIASCQFSFSSGGMDYEKLENTVTERLNEAYKRFDRQVSDVDCPRQDGKLETGDTFICTADLDGNDVRVEITVKNPEDGQVDLITLDKVYDLTELGTTLTGELGNAGVEATVDCGTGLEVVEIGKTLDCTAVDDMGGTGIVRVSTGEVGESESWELITEP